MLGIPAGCRRVRIGREEGEREAFGMEQARMQPPVRRRPMVALLLLGVFGGRRPRPCR